MTPRWHIHAIIAEVAERHGLEHDDLIGRSRLAAVNAARDEAIRAVSEKYPHYSLPRLGRVFGRDHTSIWAALNRQEKREQNNALYWRYRNQGAAA